MGKKLRFKVGDRVTVFLFPAAGKPVARAGRIAERCVSVLTGRPMLRWMVRLEEPVLVGRFWTWDVEARDADLAQYVVPESARPLSVGALHHSEVRRG